MALPLVVCLRAGVAVDVAEKVAEVGELVVDRACPGLVDALGFRRRSWWRRYLCLRVGDCELQWDVLPTW